jgi:hypothetical protein
MFFYTIVKRFITLLENINKSRTSVGSLSLTLSLPKSQLCDSKAQRRKCDQRRRNKVTRLSDLMTLFIDLGCLHCKQTQRAFNVFKNTIIDLVDQKFNWLECGNFSQDAETPGTERVIAFSQLAVKGLKVRELIVQIQAWQIILWLRKRFSLSYMSPV